jgi:hypothetical protein
VKINTEKSFGVDATACSSFNCVFKSNSLCANLIGSSAYLDLSSWLDVKAFSRASTERLIAAASSCGSLWKQEDKKLKKTDFNES